MIGDIFFLDRPGHIYFVKCQRVMKMGELLTVVDMSQTTRDDIVIVNFVTSSEEIISLRVSVFDITMQLAAYDLRRII